MQQISGVKTIEDALAAIDAIPLPQTLALPAALKDDATSTQKAAYETTVKEITRRNDFAARESALISAVKELAKARVNAVPEGEGWFAKLRLSNKSEIAGLMDRAAYETYLGGL